MTKEQWIKLVSKMDQTEEDEFKAIYNSPELMWDKVISKIIIKKEDIISILEESNSLMGQDHYGLIYGVLETDFNKIATKIIDK